MDVDLFGGIPVKNFAAALSWYEQLFGASPVMFPTPTEAVWELAEHRYLYIEELPDRAGYAMHTLFVGDFDTRVAAIRERGLEPHKEETYDNGVRKTTFRDTDGNEIGFGGAPL